MGAFFRMGWVMGHSLLRSEQSEPPCDRLPASASVSKSDLLNNPKNKRTLSVFVR